MPNLGHNPWNPDGQSGLRCTSDDARIMHPESFLVKRRNQPMEGHGCKKLLDQVRACPEFAEGMPSASNTIPIAPSRPTSAGLNATSTSTARPTRCLLMTVGMIVISPVPRRRERPQVSQLPHSNLTGRTPHILAAKTVLACIAPSLPKVCDISKAMVHRIDAIRNNKYTD